MTTKHECAYCGTTSGLRVAGTDCNGRPDDFICADCFTGTDTGPCFDDLPLAPIPAGHLPVEALKPGMGIVIKDNSWGQHCYLIHDIEELHHGEEFRISYGSDNGRWMDEVSFEAGALVEVSA